MFSLIVYGITLKNLTHWVGILKGLLKQRHEPKESILENKDLPSGIISGIRE
jgi:hypothetical protein